MSEYGAPVQYGPDGQQFYLAHEWQPGMDVVQGGLVDGAPLLSPVQSMGPGVPAVYDPSQLGAPMQSEAERHAAWSAASTRVAASTANTSTILLLLS